MHSDPRTEILSEGLRQHGIELAVCNEPLGVDSAGRVEILQRLWMTPFLLGRVAPRWRALARAARAMPRPDAVLVGHPGHLDILLARKLFGRVPIILDHPVLASAAARRHGVNGSVHQALLGGLDRAALRRADTIVVTSELERSRLPVTDRDRAVVSPIGAADEWLEVARPADEVSTDTLKVVFFGAFTASESPAVIGRAMAELAGEAIDVTMIGDGPEHAEARVSARANDRVIWIDRVEPGDLPKVVADHDVCLGEFGPGWTDLDVLPAKVYHAAAAGCAVVTAGPVAQPVFGRSFSHVPPCNSAALASVLRRLALDSGRLVRMRESAGNLARMRFAPEEIVRPILNQVRPLLHPRETS